METQARERRKVGSGNPGTLKLPRWNVEPRSVSTSGSETQACPRPKGGCKTQAHPRLRAGFGNHTGTPTSESWIGKSSRRGRASKLSFETIQARPRLRSECRNLAGCLRASKGDQETSQAHPRLKVGLEDHTDTPTPLECIWKPTQTHRAAKLDWKASQARPSFK